MDKNEPIPQMTLTKNTTIILIIAGMIMLAGITGYLAYKLNQKDSACNDHWTTQLEKAGFEIRNGVIKNTPKNNVTNQELNYLDYQNIGGS